jgi:tryptophan-rich sensory protein
MPSSQAGRARTDGFGRGDLWRVAVAVVGVNLVGAAPALLAGPDSAWFQALEKPAIYPPPWLFGVVWTLLFTLLGVAVALVWRVGLDEPAVRRALLVFAGQFALNVAWTPAFFAARRLALALAIVLLLWVAILVTIRAFDRVDRRAALLLVPYLLWVSFAAVLTYEFWRLA